MKSILFLAAFMLLSMSASAQDVIVKKNGEEIRAKVEEVGEQSIRYRKFTNLTGPVYSIARGEVFVIRYESGAKDIITPLDRPAAAGKTQDTGIAAADYPWPRVTKSYRPGDLFDEEGVRGIVISTTDNGRHGLILSLEQSSKRLRWSADSSWATDLLLGLSDREDGWNNRRRLIEWLAEGKLTWEDFPAFEWCESLGPGWYLPAVDELRGLWPLCGETEVLEKFGNKESYRFSRRISELSQSYGGDKLSILTDDRFWWSSTERKDNIAQIIDFGMPLQTRLVNISAYRSDQNHIRTKTWQQFVEAGWEKTGKCPIRAVHKF